MSSEITDQHFIDGEPELVFVGFALSECTVRVEADLVKYLRAVHRTALELAVHNQFGVEVGGFWLTTDQIRQLIALCDYYPPNEAPLVAQAIEAYLQAQTSWVCLNKSYKD